MDSKTTRITGMPVRENSFVIPQAVSIHNIYTRVTDRQTDTARLVPR